MKRKPITLPESVIPREYQIDACDAAIYLASAKPDQWHLFSAPTGTGKSLIILMIMSKVDSAICVTNRLEIVAGLLDKLGYYVGDMSTDELVELAASYGIFTPIRLRNWLAKGKLPYLPDLVIVDECHHDTASSYQDITMYLNGVPKVGFTATPYRGTPKGTQEFHQQWNDTINEILSLRDAVEQGYCKLPVPTLWPLVDDDLIEVTNGEISSRSADAHITSRVSAIIDRIKPFRCRKSRLYDKPTIIALPTTNLVNQMVTELNMAGLPAMGVTQATKRKDRAEIFRKTVACETILVQIDVVSEGVDLPIRRLIDARATMSPVKWVQQLGRIMRPGEDDPEYICCCRNLERHCYLMEGMFPLSVVKEAQEAFATGPSKRAGIRAMGLEGLGKFLSTSVSTISGLEVQTYNIVSMDEFKRTEYFVLVHPNDPEPIRAARVIPKKADGTLDWYKGRWKLLDKLPDLKGFASAKPFPLSERQTARWNDSAKDMGLNPFQKVDARKIQILFFLRDIRKRLA